MTTVAVSPATPTVFMGDTLQLTATVRDQRGNVMTGKQVTWTSDVPSVASVDSSGLVVAQASGTARISAAVESKSGTAVFTSTGPGTGGGVPGSAIIGATGGSVLATLPGGGSLSLSIPGGALLEPVTVTLDPIQPPAGALAAFLISPGGLELAEPATLVIRVSAGAKVRPTTTLVFNQEGGPVPVSSTPNLADGSVTVSLRSLGLPSTASGGAALRLPTRPIGSTASGPSQGMLLSIALGQRFNLADAALRQLQTVGTVPTAGAMESAMQAVLALDRVAAMADSRFGPLLFDWKFEVCGAADFALHALQSFGVVSDYRGLERVIRDFLGWSLATAAVDAFQAQVGFNLTCAASLPGAEAEVLTKLQTMQTPIITDLNGFALTPSPRDSAFFVDRLKPLLDIVAKLRQVAFDPAAQLLFDVVVDQVDRVRQIGYSECRFSRKQEIQSRLARAMAGGGGVLTALAAFSGDALESDIELCGMLVNWRLRDSTNTPISTGSLGGGQLPGTFHPAGSATLTGEGNLELHAGLLYALLCPTPASANAEQLEVAAGLNALALTRVAVLTPSNQNDYLAVSSLLVPSSALRSATGIAPDATGTAVVVVRRIGGTCSGMFANLVHSSIGRVNLTLAPPPPCPTPVAGNLGNVCQPPPPPPPPANCDSYRIDSDARFAAASGVTCASNMSIGGFNNSLTVLVSFPQLTQIVESFAVRAEVPGGLSLPALSSVGSPIGGCGALFEMGKLAVLDVPALANALGCGLTVRNAPDLTTLKLGALALVEGGFDITGNPKLTDISGVACGARVAGNLTITDNPQLSTTAAQALANCLIVTGTVTIQRNKP